MLERHIFDGEVIGESRSHIILVSFQGSINGCVVAVLEKFLETVSRVEEVGEAKGYSYVDVGSSSGEVSDFIEHHLMGQTRRKTY